MKLQGLFLFFTVAFAALAQTLFAQPANDWRAFKKSDGLIENTCVSVTLSASGKVLIRHARSSVISTFDGYEIKTVPGPGTNRNRIYESAGGQLWTVAPEGLQEFRDGEWVLYRVEEIAEHTHSGRTNEITLLPVRQGRVLILLPDRLLQLNAEDTTNVRVELLRRADQTQLGVFTGMNMARDGGLRVSGATGYAKINESLRNLKFDSEWVERVPPPELRIHGFGTLQEDEVGVISAFVQSAGGHDNAIVSFNGKIWATSAVNVRDVRWAWRDPGGVWFATDNALLQLEDGKSNPVLREDFSVRKIFDVAVQPDGAFWIATSDGLFRHAPTIWKSAPASAIKPTANVGALPVLPDEISKRARWKSYLTARSGDVWLGGVHEIAWRHQNVWQFFTSTNQIGPEDVIGFAESPDGRIRCATPYKVWEFDGKNWLVLRSGLDRVNALHCGRDGTFWVATENGLHRFVQDEWITNGPEDGLPSAAVRGILEDDSGRITVNTDRGASTFHPDADSDAPMTFITADDDPEHSVREGTSMTIDFDGRDKWKITTANRLLFSYRLDEQDWLPFQETSWVSFDDLSLGKHYFQVRAMDRAGNIDLKPARLEFTVVVPWYRETRLVLILTVALAVAIFFAALAINRHHELQRSYAEVERQVAERTRQLELANRELLHSQKMNALGSLAAGIAHDFNNILSIIKGSAQLIEDNADKPDKIRTRVDRIKTVVQQGAEVVEAMLGFSRSTDQPPAPCNINTVVDETRKLLGDRFLREAEVRFERSDELPEISVARDFVQQILLNFIFNAAEAMSGRKQITLATRLVEKLPTELYLSPAGTGRYIFISVSDTGSGIAPEIKARIFEPFFTTKALSTKRGTGLGLSMVYELARKMEAGLAVESVVGRGSTFTLILPVREKTSGTPGETTNQHANKS